MDDSSWWNNLTPGKVARGVLVVMLVLLGFVAILALRTPLILLFVGVVLATAVRPLMAWLRRVRLPRWLAALLALSMLLAIIGGLAALMLPFLLIQGQLLLASLPDYYGILRDGLVASPYRVVRIFGNRLPAMIVSAAGSGEGGLVVQLAAWAPQLLGAAIGILGAFLFGYYWLLDRERAIQTVTLTIPIDRRESARALWEAIAGKIGAFVRGQLILCLSVGLLSLLGYWLAGLPYAGLLAIFAGVLELVPVIGPVIAAVPAIVVGMSVSVEVGIYALVVSLLVQGLENNLLVPKIMDQAVGVSPVVSLLALAAFSALFGLTGALLAIPLAAALQVLLDAWLLRNAVDPEQVQGRDQLAVLRYQAQDLTQDLRAHLRATQPDSAGDEDFLEEELEAVIGAIDALLAEAADNREQLIEQEVA